MFYKGEIPFVRFLIPLVFGVVFGRFFSNLFLTYWGFAFCFFILCLFLFLFLSYKSYSLFRLSWIFGLIIHFFLFMIGYSRTVNDSGRLNPLNFNQLKADFLILSIQNEPSLSGANFRFEGEVMGVYTAGAVKETSGKILVSLQADSTGKFVPAYGDILIIPAVYNEFEPPYNPGEFNYRLFMENRQVYFQSYINANQFHLLPDVTGNPLISFALSYRKKLIRKYNSFLPDQDAAALASTLILGYRAELNREIIEAYSKTGTMHVLSVSGMHVGIVFLVFSVLLKPMERNKVLIFVRILIILTAIWFYSLISGFSSPVCRAALMISFVLIGKALNRSQNSYNLIAISAFFLLLYYPFYLFDVGFQLSYLAVCGLIYFHPKLYHTFYFKNKFADYVWSYSTLSIAAQLATFPLGLYYFHQFPLYFLLSNLLIVLPVTVIMYSGILMLIIPFELVLIPLGQFLSGLINLNNDVLYRIERLPFSSLSGIWINDFQLILLCTLILSLVLWSKFRLKTAVLTLLSLSLILLMSVSLNRILNFRREELIFFSLRKNSAIAYLKSGKSIVLADFDSLDRAFSYSVKPGLESLGYSDIRLLNIDDLLVSESCWSDANFMQFGNFRVLRWDRKMRLSQFKSRLKIDILIMSRNPDQKISDINAFVEFKKVLIDPTNSDYNIQSWLTEAAKLNISSYVLKKSPAYIIKL